MTIITVIWERIWRITGKLRFSATTALKALIYMFNICVSFYSWSFIWRVVNNCFSPEIILFTKATVFGEFA